MVSKARPSFSRKRSKKLLFGLSRIHLEGSASALAKAFWSFFSKKDYLLTTSHGQGGLVLLSMRRFQRLHERKLRTFMMQSRRRHHHFVRAS